MRRMLWVLAGIFACGLVVAAILAVAGVAGWNEFVAGTTLTIDGETIRFGRVESRHLAPVLALATVGSLVVVVVAAVLVTVAVVAVVFAVLAAALSGAVTLAVIVAPVALVAWLVWRIRRSPPPRQAGTAPA